MKPKKKVIYTAATLLSLGVLLVVAVLIVLNQPRKSESTATPESGDTPNSQDVYPYPRGNIQQLNNSQAYPPPSTPGLQPSSTATAPKVEPSPTPTKASLSLEDIERTTQHDAKVAFDGHTALFVDVRSVQSFSSSHVPGAISIPEPQILEMLKEMDPNKWIITYCS